MLGAELLAVLLSRRAGADMLRQRRARDRADRRLDPAPDVGGGPAGPSAGRGRRGRPVVGVSAMCPRGGAGRRQLQPRSPVRRLLRTAGAVLPPPDGLRPLQPMQPPVPHVQRRPLVVHPQPARAQGASATRVRRRLLRRAARVPPPPRGGLLPGRRALPVHRSAPGVGSDDRPRPRHPGLRGDQRDPVERPGRALPAISAHGALRLGRRGDRGHDGQDPRGGQPGPGHGERRTVSVGRRAHRGQRGAQLLPHGGQLARVPCLPRRRRPSRPRRALGHCDGPPSLQSLLPRRRATRSGGQRDG